MLEEKNWDFSRESSIKKTLLQKMQEVVRLAPQGAVGLSDDDLELVQAALGNDPGRGICPYPELACVNCQYYQGNDAFSGVGQCTLQYHK